MPPPLPLASQPLLTPLRCRHNNLRSLRLRPPSITAKIGRGLRQAPDRPWGFCLHPSVDGAPVPEHERPGRFAPGHHPERRGACGGQSYGLGWVAAGSGGVMSLVLGE